MIQYIAELSTKLDARPLWWILNDYGLTTGIVGWPLTSPGSTG